MNLNLRFLIERSRSAIARRIGYPIDLIESASMEVLDNGGPTAGGSCVVLPNQFDRVTACAFELDPKKEIAELSGAYRTVPPTVRYELKNVIIHDGIIYGGSKRKYFNPEVDFGPAATDWLESDELALRSSFVGCHFFGHWLRDDCATHLLAETTNHATGIPTPAWPDKAGYLELFRQSPADVRRAYVRRLVLFDDIHQTNHKGIRFRRLRERIASTRSAKSDRKIVYLARGAQGKQRHLVNEPQLIEALSTRGIKIVRAETLSVQELILQLSGAEIIISIEGSQLSHALYTVANGGGILVLQPPNRFFNSHFDWARLLDIAYGIVVGRPQEDGFQIPLDDVIRTLDLLRNRTAQTAF